MESLHAISDAHWDQEPLFLGPTIAINFLVHSIETNYFVIFAVNDIEHSAEDGALVLVHDKVGGIVKSIQFTRQFTLRLRPPVHGKPPPSLLTRVGTMNRGRVRADSRITNNK